jgi:hypothetical protein
VSDGDPFFMGEGDVDAAALLTRRVLDLLAAR